MKINPKNMSADQLVDHYASEYAQKTTARSEWINNTIKNYEATKIKPLMVGGAAGAGAFIAAIGAASTPVLFPAVAMPLLAVGAASLAVFGMKALKAKIAENMKFMSDYRMKDLTMGGGGDTFRLHVENKLQKANPGFSVQPDMLRKFRLPAPGMRL